MEKLNMNPYYLAILIGLVFCSGCISDNTGKNYAGAEKPGNLSPSPAVTDQARPDFEQCAHEEVSGLEDTYIEFLPGELQKTINYTFSNTLAIPTEVTYDLVPVRTWGEKNPAVVPDWVNVSVEPSSLTIPPCQNETSIIRISLIRNATDNSSSSPPTSQTAFFYLKPVTNLSTYSDAEDWLCIQENYNYRTLLRPRLTVSIEHADLVVHPGSENQTSLIINTQSQGLATLQTEILAEDTLSADVLEEGLLQVKLDPPTFSTRSFRQYSSVLLVNASDRLPSGTYRFTLVIHSKSLAQLHIRIENPA